MLTCLLHFDLMMLSSFFFPFLFSICSPGILTSPEVDAGPQIEKVAMRQYD